jgi:hypothetical protein
VRALRPPPPRGNAHFERPSQFAFSALAKKRLSLISICLIRAYPFPEESKGFVSTGQTSVAVCDQHRRSMTEWVDGAESLAPWAPLRFAFWQVEPRGPFVPEEQEPLELVPFFPVE